MITKNIMGPKMQDNAKPSTMLNNQYKNIFTSFFLCLSINANLMIWMNEIITEVIYKYLK